MSSATATRIQRLSPEVVNRIAAGEVIHRPANALKELLENSLDAGATQISVTVSQGGLKLLQIQDNGKGIHRQDLEIVCERFTTSKLRTFDDLRDIASFGFRGEALASISHVAHVTIVSKTADQPCAYKAFYRDGKLTAKKPGVSSDPTPCAGKNGTQITVEDLFYNLTTRRQAFKNTSEQYQRIVEVVQRYAVHFGGKQVSFVCKKHRESSCDVNTLTSNSQLDVIKQLFGSKLGSELVEFEYSLQPTPPNRDFEFEVHAWVSNANYNLKSSNFILFINDRLVDCAPLKRACEYVYSLYLPKHTHPFVYMSLKMPAYNLDVNVHPTKREVHFLYEEQIVERISQELEKKLKGSNESRVFVVQPITSMMQTNESKQKGDRTTLPLADTGATGAGGRTVLDSDDDTEDETKEDSASSDDENRSNEEEESNSAPVASQSVQINLSQHATPESKKYHPAKAPQKLVRTDHRSNTIDKYFFLESQRNSQLSLSQTEVLPSSRIETTEEELSTRNRDVREDRVTKRRRLSDSIDTRSEPEEEEEDVDASARRESIIASTQDAQMLTSVQNLMQRIERRTSKALVKLFRGHTFVGVVNRKYSLIQYRTKLYMVRHRDVAYHLFYEKVIQQFGSFGAFQLPTPLSTYELVYEALGNPRSGYDPEDGPRDQLADEIKELLVNNGPMLAEYFSINIDAQGMLRSLPRLLVDHEPSLHSLPEFVFHLATEVNWEEEEPCFDNVAHALAQWYSEIWYPTHPSRAALVLEHVVFPAMKNANGSESQSGALLQFLPPEELNDSAILRPIACLTKLYRIFERC